MTRQLPPPLVPAEVDLRDFGFMPLHVARLRDSDLTALASGEEFKSAVLLWCFAWHQSPAGSLPNDDRILAERSGAKARSWKRIRLRALHGFVECSDGRLYHPVIAEAALEAWARRDAYQASNAARETRQQRWRHECARLAGLLRAAGITPPAKPTKAQLVDLCRLHVDGFVDADVDGRDAHVDADVDAGETRRDAGEMRKTGTGTGTGTVQDIEHASGAPDVQGKGTEGAERKKPQGRGARIPIPFEISDELKAWAAEQVPNVDLAKATEKFVDYWRAVSGQRGLKRDWDATWRNWMREEATRARPAAAVKPSDKPWTPPPDGPPGSEIY